MTMSKVMRVTPHLTSEAIDARRKNLHDFWRLRRWMIIRHALVEPAPAKDSALRLGLSVFPVRDLIAADNRHGPEALATPGKGQRQHAYLAVAAERTLLAPFLEDSQAGPMAIARMLKKAVEDSLGHRVATSTIYRLLHRHHWRKVVPRPNNPRRSKAAQDTLKKTSPPSSRQRWKRERLMICAPSFSWRKRKAGVGVLIP
jgi:transposase